MNMIVLALLVSWLALYSLASASPEKSPRPLVLWHGLGDSHSSPGMLEFASRIKDIHPGIFIHSIYIDQDLDNDRRAGFYGNVDDQIELVADQISAIDQLKDGFDAIGLSQGGQFLRAYVERHNSPPIHNLITFGSQHMGVSDIPLCRPLDFLCQMARRATKGAVYSNWAQNNSVQAQYFRDPANLITYLTANRFLTSINNELPPSRNETYARNLASLNTLVLVIFTQDKTVVPKETAWFASEVVLDDDDSIFRPSQSKQKQINLGPTAATNEQRILVPMRLQPLYKEDWIGLRALDERGGVVFDVCEGEHMRMDGCWEPLVRRFVGGFVGGFD